MLRTIVLIYGGFALIFGLWTLFGLLKRGSNNPHYFSNEKRWFLGVCADFSRFVGIPLWIVRLYALAYLPCLLGIPFYFLYYFTMKGRKPPPKKIPVPERNVTVTHMDTRHYH